MPDQAKLPSGLAADALVARCDPAALPFASTAELGEVSGLIGQERAVEAIQLAAAIDQPEFNLFVVGPQGTGRHDTVQRLLADEAAQRPVPEDWIYVNNFEASHKPVAIRLPPGLGPKFAAAVEAMVDDLATDIPALFESEEYQAERHAIDEKYTQMQEAALQTFAERIAKENVAMVRTPMGYMLTAKRGGELLDSDAFEKLDPDEREAIDKKISHFQKELAEVMRRAPLIDRERRHTVEALNAAMAERVVSERVAALDPGFSEIAPLAAYLEAVRADMIANADVFIKVAANKDDGPFPGEGGQMHLHPAFGRYRVNVLITRDPAEAKGAPVESEDLPTLDRLTGRIDHESMMGSLVTNFTMIRPGALHRANGGYLVLDARRVLAEPYAWDALKRSLKTRTLTITSLAERLSLLSTTALEPDPIPLDLRVVLIGDRLLHALLVLLDPDFSELFKVQADFDDRVVRSADTLELYARLIGAFIAREKMPPFEAAAVARLLDEATRLAEDKTKISLRLGALAQLMREAQHYASGRDAASVGAEDVARAIGEKERRGARVRERMQEAVARGTVLIDTDGARVGQVNGLSVIGLGDDRFGQPSRITARVRLGTGKLVDIEREVELGGPIHSKGVMILGGYLTASYAQDVPFSLQASIVFEQSYGGVEGDSASSAELYALISALSELPINQGLAVTGSVNQLGEVQAIGGVNEKIEGFFDTCAARGLTGRQGVLIPAANVEHLMLRDRVVDAVSTGKFRILPVRTIDEGIALLTGKEAGARGADGRYPDGSVNALVEARLETFAERRRAFARKPGAESAEPDD